MGANENARFLDCDTMNIQTMTLLRKFRMPPAPPFYTLRPVGGKFQGANRADFRDSVTLHVIQEPSYFNWVDVKPENPDRFRYVRYLSAPGVSYNNMAEVQFYSDGTRLQGEVTGTDGSHGDYPNDTKHAVFDGDPLTFFSALSPDSAWAGLELDKAYRISAIRYIFRNDDNGIRQGDMYELLYNSNGEWISSGKQTADSTLLLYENVPSNTLYRLRNHTRGREERPFTYENGIQVWW